MPDTPPIPIRGRTIQKRESWVATHPALFTSATVTTTFLPSSVSTMLRTLPITTSL